MALRFLHLSDLDLGARPAFMGASAESRSQEILETFRKAVAHALEPANRIDALLITGNLFDRHRPSADVWAFVRGLFGRLAGSRKPTIVIPGSRDSSCYKDSVYRTERLPGVDVLTATRAQAPIEREIAGQRVFFYGQAPQPGAQGARFPGFERCEEEGLHIGLLNGAMPDHPEWELRPRDLIIDPATLAESGLDYVALGGYHGFTPLHLNGSVAAYAGSLEGRAFVAGDLGRKSLLVVEVDDGDVSFEQHPISTKVMEDWKLDLTAEQIMDANALSAALLSRSGTNVIARISLTGNLEFLCDLDDLTDSVRQRFAWLEVADRTDLLESTLLRRIQGEATIRGYFVRKLIERIEELHERIANDPASESLLKQLEVSRLALKTGLEQFLEEEPVSHMFEPAEQVHTEELATTNGSSPPPEVPSAAPPVLEPAARAQVLLKSDRERQAEIRGEASA